MFFLLFQNTDVCFRNDSACSTAFSTPWTPATSVPAVQGMSKSLVSFAGAIIGLALVQYFFLVDSLTQWSEVRIEHNCENVLVFFVVYVKCPYFRHLFDFATFFHCQK
jgi:hypothetical protein